MAPLLTTIRTRFTMQGGQRRGMFQMVGATVNEGDVRTETPAPPGEAGGAAVRRRLRALAETLRLSPSQRRLARYLIDHADEAGFLTSVDLAQRVGVSQPSATRFAAALGFAGYPELRDAIRSWMLGIDADGQAEEVSNDFQRMITHEVRNLTVLAESLRDPTPILEMGRHLATSKPLIVIGLRVSAPIASLFAYCARSVHPDVRLVTNSGLEAEDLISQARNAGAASAIVFALPRYPRELLTVMEWARRIGLRVNLITDQAISPLTSAADATLAAAVAADLDFDSQAAPTALSMIVLQAMFDAMPVRQQQSLEDFDTSAAERRIFLAP